MKVHKQQQLLQEQQIQINNSIEEDKIKENSLDNSILVLEQEDPEDTSNNLNDDNDSLIFLSSEQSNIN